jgi:peptide/nickel transport system permease protein
MTRYLVHRLLSTIPTLFGITLVAFLILNVLPSDPVLNWSESGTPLSAEAIQRLRAELGAEAPPHVRYAVWLAHAARLDFGTSLRDARPVGTIVGEALPYTLLLNLCAVLLIYGLGVPIGLAGARHPGGKADRAARGFLLIVFVVPPFAAALLLQRLLAVRWHLLPLQGVTGDQGSSGSATLDLLRHLVLPALCLAFSGWAYAARYARAAFRTVAERAPITAARARGLWGGRLLAHFAPNAALPFLSLLGGMIPGLLAGSVVVEEIFSWPGLGRLLLRAVSGRDYPVVLALVLLSGVAVLAGQLCIDLLYPALDPRLRPGVAGEARRPA